jgi:hypothetical protein
LGDAKPKAARASASPKATRKCPDSFVVTADHVAWAGTEAPGIDIGRETRKFRDHQFATARSDWPATWRNWIREAFDRQKKPVGGNGSVARSFRERDADLQQARIYAASGGLMGAPLPEQDTIDMEAPDNAVTPRIR